MTRRHVFPFFVLAFLILGCKYFQAAQKLESEAAVENPNATKSDSQLFLNSEDIGTVSRIGKREAELREAAEPSLEKTLRSIVDYRESNGIFLEGSNEIAKRVYLHIQPDLTVAGFAKIFTAVKELGATPLIPNGLKPPAVSKPVVPLVQKDNSFTARPDTEDFDRPDPLHLEIRTQSADTELYRFQNSKRIRLLNLEVEYVISRDALLSTRAFQDSIEISADERLFANDKHTDDQGPKYTQVKQRQITTDVLKSELERIKASGNPITIIVSDKASYGKLLSVLETIDAEFLVLVRQSL